MDNACSGFPFISSLAAFSSNSELITIVLILTGRGNSARPRSKSAVGCRDSKTGSTAWTQGTLYVSLRGKCSVSLTGAVHRGKEKKPCSSTTAGKNTRTHRLPSIEETFTGSLLDV